ncbi:restriction endonuclease subunit S domain-containing protein [Helicobacter pylori]|uniref:restriction endonuclease subunit S n=1 Tax=Helicobacter pylori TaxID=210 RepID=UPI00123BD498|nr:restriction endonuclease subunit S [Helicobacter pylori]KAA6494443.1 restriction endonuclease subunit S [Helicobacter pylori]
MSKTLQDYATLINDTIQSNEINHYITTANMCQNLGGIDTFKNINIPQGKIRSFQKDDVLLSNIDPWHRQVYMAKQKGGCSSDVLVFRAKHIDSATLFAILSSQSFINYVCLGSVGSKRKRGDKTHMMDFKIPTINFTIAKIFNSIQNKIENNHKINELLHKILELLYEQYFIRFDFLDGNNKPYQTSGGKMKFSKELNRLIPNDFEVKTLGDNPLCNTIKTGVTPFKQKMYYETKHIKVSYNKRPNRANMQPTIYSVWFAKMKDTKKHLFLNQHMQSWIKESILSTGFCGLQCQKHTFEYIASTIKYSSFETRKNNLATGATQKAINIEMLDYIFILIPNKGLLDNYSKITKPLYEKISNNIIETQTLTALRDFLLPLLLTQQVKPK